MSISFSQKVFFAKHLAVMLDSGLTIRESLEVIADTATGSFKKILTDAIERIDGGAPLSEVLKDYERQFSRLFVNVVKAGEQSGTLPENLRYLADQLYKEQTIRNKVQGAMVYPAIIFFAVLFLSIGMVQFVFPQITPLFTGLKIDLPLTTKAIIWLGTVFGEYGAQIIFSLIFGALFVVYLLKRSFMHPITHWILLHIPIVKKLVVQTNIIRFTLTLGTLLKSGLHIDQALEIAKGTVTNVYYRRAIASMEKKVAAGRSLTSVCSEYTHLFPKVVKSMVNVGEESGTLPENLLYIADFYEQEIDTTTKTLTTSLEPLLLLGIGIVVAILALSIITPIYQVTGNLGR